MTRQDAVTSVAAATAGVALVAVVHLVTAALPWPERPACSQARQSEECRVAWTIYESDLQFREDIVLVALVLTAVAALVPVVIEPERRRARVALSAATAAILLSALAVYFRDYIVPPD